jgi:inhibitor of nuclear factor kappa-B kinase subunit alpha
LDNDLGLWPYKKIKRHGLTTKNKEDRVKRSEALLKRHDDEAVKKMVFSDEKMWVLQESYNAQNKRVYARTSEDIPQNLRTVQRYQNSSAVMVWGAISHKGKLPLIFIDKDVKINQDVYRSEILETHLKPEASRLYPKRDWIFQQDSAPAHRAIANQVWCERNCPKFIPTKEWPASSPDLNPLDYFVWGYLEPIVNKKQHHSLDALKRTLSREWDRMSMKLVRAAIDGWRGRLRAVINSNGDRFE